LEFGKAEKAIPRRRKQEIKSGNRNGRKCTEEIVPSRGREW